MKKWFLVLLSSGILQAQDFPFHQQFTSIPVDISNWSPYSSWNFGLSESVPCFCDINADGDEDLFLGDFQGFIPYFENQGNLSIPQFVFITSAFDSLSAVSGWGHSSPDFCDIDGDGDYDLFVGAGLIALYVNEGNAWSFLYNPEADTIRDTQDNWVIGTHVELVDIDADGDYDLIGGEYQGYMYFYRNIGSYDSFSFFLESNYWEGISVGSYANPTFCDIDADGDYDLFIGNSAGKIWYYRNDGDSVNYNFTYMTNNWLDIDVGEYASPEFCDIDADGDYDLFVGREPTYSQQHMGDVFFYENVGTPEIADFQYITSNYLTLDVGSDSRQQLVDIDADGDLDLFVGASDEIRFFRNTGTGENPAFTLEEEYYQGINLESIIPYFCDIDADGDYDLFAGEGEIPGPPGLHLYINRGTPQQPDYVLYSDDLVPGNYFVMINPALVDIDADGDYDLFITDDDNYTGTNNIWFYENVGSPTEFSFAAAITNWEGINILSPAHRYLRFYDIDEDGDLDLFFNNNWMEGSENLRFYENVGTMQSPQMVWRTNDYLPFEVPVPCAWFADIDSDSFTDLFVGDANGGILFFHGVDTSAVPPLPRTAPYRGPVLSVGPNPANPVTTFSFELRAASSVNLTVYDVSGRRVAELLSGRQEAGAHVVTWDASGLGSGVYLARLQVGGESQAGKVVVVK